MISKNNNSDKVSNTQSSREGMWAVDLNCDLGEGAGNDEAIMPHISSANIACGYHAGNEETIWQTIELAVNNNVSIGAHPSFLDKQNFGRVEFELPPEEIYELVTQQMILFDEILTGNDTKMHHIKPHGALYNLSAKNYSVARAIASAVKDHDPDLILFGLSGSHSIIEAKAIGLKTASEVFADRTYQDDGMLTARSNPNPLIEDSGMVVRQVLQMIKEKTVTTLSGKTIPILAETICLHGDGKNTIELAMKINQALKENNIGIQRIL